MARPAEQLAAPSAARRGRRSPEHGLPATVAKLPGGEDQGVLLEVEGRERSDRAVGRSLKGGGGQW
jgi:hypothetical protein